MRLLVLGLAAVAAGIVNALAGGGTFITFPALTAFGIAPSVANMTNTVALSPGYIGGTLAQRRDLAGQARRVTVFCSVGVAGGVAGGWLLLVSDRRVFAVLVPFLILGASILLTLQPRLRALVERHASARDVAAWAPIAVFVASVYGGYFGAGLGIVLLATLGLGVGDTLTRINALKQAVSFAVNTTAAAFFVVAGKVVWPAAAVMSAGALIGGAVGGRLAGGVPVEVLRRIVAGVGVIVAGIFFARLVSR